MAHLLSRRNPYIIGRPIDEPKLLFGRQDLFCFLEDNLSQGIKVTLLHGQRRIGKSSIIRNIPKYVKLEDFVFIPFNLEDYTRENLSTILAELAKEIIEHLQIDAKKIKPPSIEDLDKDPYIFYSQFLTKIYDELDSKKIVFLLDEFDALIDKYSASLLEKFFTYLHSIIEVEDKLFLIIFAGRQSANMPNLLNYFQDASTREIGFLNENSATELITQPAQGILEYEPGAIQAIIELSAGHPYFIQVICFAIFVRARELDEWHINIKDIDNIVDKAIENAEAGLAWFWDGLTIPEKVVFSAVAESQKIAIEKSQIVPENPLKLLKKYGVVKTEVLEQAVKELVAYNFLYETGNRIKIELVRRWLLQRHPLRQEIKELEKLNSEESYSNYEAKKQLPAQEKKQNNLANYNTTLAPSPKSFNYALAVAEEYLHKEDYPTTLENLQFSTQNKKREPEILEKEEKSRSISKIQCYSPTKSRLSKSVHAVVIAGAMAISAAITGIGISRLSTPCLASENKVLGVFCVDDPSVNLSNGDRTFFAIINNAYRDQGIESFKNGNYEAAVKLFRQAVQADRTDPEVLIYYNNALAREKGNYFTLAVVVSADNNTNFAQEILRGVAQAQQEFNNKDGLNGRLLSIIIANDGNGKEPEKAKQVAAELVKTNSLLGVIGHNYSEATKAALTEYENVGISVISPTSSNTSLHKSNVFFRTVPSDAAMGEKLAKYAINNLNLTRVVIFKSTSFFSESMTQEFQNNFEELGGKIVRQIDLTERTLNAQKEVKLSLANQAQAAILIPDRQYTDVALDIAKANNNIINSSKNQKKPGLKLLGANTLYSDETLSKAGKAVEGLIAVVPWFRDAAQAKEYAQKAKKLWKSNVTWRTASSYDATQAFIQDLSSDSNRTTILASLENAKFSVNETSGYPLKFSDEGERETEPILVQIKGGKFVAVP
ncbi:ABC-type branched-chain amino acid transport system, periplasmic component [Nostoc flagelliforme CCNUN1]|uniref:ABC-type branched-chain amino acid transport system, periplasmic component n=1 Tax=Nostoc flagelliforme CCNUN1 TaxID=2038116 RepID=A0A2K8SW31_9NOSO|nr:ABC transporter substrate-binding protein [Nostoc flagelliforme]AUB39627.1 ABC-type branched-chain amino acid transport system, periplasmic component [Nostoc flagelliforme CCNUN1]